MLPNQFAEHCQNCLRLTRGKPGNCLPQTSQKPFENTKTSSSILVVWKKEFQSFCQLPENISWLRPRKAVMYNLKNKAVREKQTCINTGLSR